LETSGVHVESGHFEFPAPDSGRVGNHLQSLFLIEPIAENKQFIGWIADDIVRWIEKRNLIFDVIFAPSQPAVKKIAHRIAERTATREAYWEYLPSGWFGTKCLEGEIHHGDKVLIFNAVTPQGRCVGERLPAFVEQLKGNVVGAAVFAKGTAAGVAAAEQRYGELFYSSIQVQIDVLRPDQCQQCQAPGATRAIPWTELRDRKSGA